MQIAGENNSHILTIFNAYSDGLERKSTWCVTVCNNINLLLLRLFNTTPMVKHSPPPKDTPTNHAH